MLKSRSIVRPQRSGLVSDYATDTRWRKGIRAMTPDVPGPPKVGTNVHEVLHLAGRDYVTETTVTEVGPGLSYRFAGAGDSGQVSGRRSVRAGARPDRRCSRTTSSSCRSRSRRSHGRFCCAGCAAASSATYVGCGLWPRPIASRAGWAP